jgi:ABC-type sugar transport system ATPase subunit
MENIKLINIKNLSKNFIGVQALKNIDFDLYEGEIHGLVGHNGAGKSTLINIISGFISFDSGYLTINSNKIDRLSPILAKKFGIHVVYQAPYIQPNLTVAENLFISNWPRKYGLLVDWKKLKNNSKALLEKLNIPIDINRIVGELNLGQQKMIEIATAINSDSKILLLDEPTASLTINEIKLLFNFLKSLKSHGVGIVYISHHMKEIFEICDRVTVLRNGLKIVTEQANKLNLVDLTNYVMGGPVLKIEKEHKVYDEKILIVNNLNSKLLKNICFYLKKGEILGLAGLNGSGRTELLRAVCGLDFSKKKEIILNGKKIKINNYINSLSQGIAYLPENRYLEGIIPIRTIKENLTLSSLKYISTFLKIINKKLELKLVNKYIELLKIIYKNINNEITSLSGGNQQKVVFGKLLSTQTKILLLDEPTSGIDIGTKLQIFKIIEEYVNQGNSVIFVSAEINELLLICDRIVVLKDNIIKNEITNVEELDEDKLLELIAK